jgi:hypothetical protein
MRIGASPSGTTTIRLVPGSERVNREAPENEADNSNRKPGLSQSTRSKWVKVPQIANAANGHLKRFNAYAANRARVIAMIDNFSLQAVIRVHDRNGALVFAVYPHSMTDATKLFQSMKAQVREVFPSMSFTKESVTDENGRALSMFTVTISKSDLDTVYVSVFDLLRFKRFWMLCILIACLVYLLLVIW